MMSTRIETIDYSLVSTEDLMKERDRVKAELVARMVACKLNMDRNEKRMFIRKILELDDLIDRRRVLS